MSEGGQQQHHSEDLVVHTFRNVFVNPIIIHSCQFFLYGVYIFIFRDAMKALKRRPHPWSPECRFHIYSLILLFILATVDIPVKLTRDVFFWKCVFWKWEGLGLSEAHTRVLLGCQFLQYGIILLVGLIADAVMVFRFFVIWGYRKIYVVVPMVGFVLIDGLGANGILNLTLTVLIAVRIWWNSRKIKSQIGKWSTKGTNTIIAIVLESGIVYAIVQIAYVISNFFPLLRIDLNGVLVQAAVGSTMHERVVRANSRLRESHLDVPREEEETTRHTRNNVITLTQLDDGIGTPVQTTHFGLVDKVVLTTE
ncbi:hypothetical protein L218DRAFT_947756 [Marasmius fiardii PR-910]|nr:hypothetical protein L218DRAFT_947756 [Marasmius fiardii PR-910]